MRMKIAGCTQTRDRMIIALTIYIENETKWLPFCRYFQMHFPWMKFGFRLYNFTEICFWKSNWQKINAGWGNGLAPHGRQGINWANDNPVHSLLDLNELIKCRPRTLLDPHHHFNTLRPRQDGRHFPDDIFKWHFSWMKIYKFRLWFHWCLLPMVQFTIFQHWFR